MSGTSKFVGKGSSGMNGKPGKVPVGPPSPTHSMPISVTKKMHLESMLMREERKAKKERVSHVLVQKLALKFGPKYTPIISFYIDEFLEKHESITSEDLNSLEEDMKKAIVASLDTETLKSNMAAAKASLSCNPDYDPN